MKWLIVFSCWLLVLSSCTFNTHDTYIVVEDTAEDQFDTLLQEDIEMLSEIDSSLKLPKPTKQFFNKHENSITIEHEYFQEYLDVGTKKQVLKNFQGTEEVCGWKQVFKGDIVLEYEDCDEVGVNVKITFPGYSKQELVKFVEWFFKSDENKWNKEKTTYSPKEEGAGCYFEILKDSSDNYVLDYYCGC